jgi:hypothetical protein
MDCPSQRLLPDTYHLLMSAGPLARTDLTSCSVTTARSALIVRFSAAVASPHSSASTMGSPRTNRERNAPTKASPVPIGSSVSVSYGCCVRNFPAVLATAPSSPLVTTTVLQSYRVRSSSAIESAVLWILSINRTSRSGAKSRSMFGRSSSYADRAVYGDQSLLR